MRQCLTMVHMSEMTDSSIMIPQLTLGWRMQMSLRQSEHSVQAMADTLGVTRQTVGRWINDRGAPPKKAYVTQWAWLTRVPVQWLETGVAPIDGDLVTTGGYSAEPLPFPGFANTSGDWSSHGAPGEAWQQSATACRAQGSTEVGGTLSPSNDYRRYPLRGVAVHESAVEEIAEGDKVAA